MAKKVKKQRKEKEQPEIPIGFANLIQQAIEYNPVKKKKKPGK